MDDKVFSFRRGVLPEKNVEEIIRRCLSGEDRAYEELFEAILPDVRRILFSVAGSIEDMEDLMQSAFIEVFRSLPSFRGESKFSTWLYRLLVNTAFQYLKKNRLRWKPIDGADILNEMPGSFPDPERLAGQNELIEHTNAVLTNLGHKKRTVLLLHHVEGLSLEEIADLLDVSRLTVKSRLYHARKEFAKEMRKLFVMEDAKAVLRRPKGAKF